MHALYTIATLKLKTVELPSCSGQGVCRLLASQSVFIAATILYLQTDEHFSPTNTLPRETWSHKLIFLK